MGAAWAAELTVPGQYATIQAAIDAAADGDTVLVSAGTYFERIDYKGKAISVVSTDGAAATVIDGLRAGTVVMIDGNDVSPGPLADVVLEGFTVTGGGFGEDAVAVLNAGATIRNNRIVDNLSRGIRIAGDLASPLVEDNVISGNQDCSGAGMEIYFSSPTVRNNQIVDNVGTGCSGGLGVGVYIGGFGQARLEGNVIEGNRSFTGAGGGGIVLFAAGEPEIVGNWIIGNQVDSDGGGLEIYNSSNAYFANNVIAGNIAGGRGGGLYWLVPSGDPGPVMVNNTIVDNQASEGSAIYSDGFDASVLLVNNVLAGTGGVSALYCSGDWDASTPLLHFNDVYSPGGAAYGGACADATGTDGNISVAPGFADAAGQDYRLAWHSSLVDAGSAVVLTAPTADILHRDRPQGPAIDIGAFEAPAHASLALVGGAMGPGTTGVAAALWDGAAGRQFSHVMDPFAASAVATVPLTPESVKAQVAVGDLDGNGAGDLAVLTVDADGFVEVKVKDGLSGTLVSRMSFEAAYRPWWLRVVPATAPGGTVELAVLGVDDSGRARAQVRDALTGALVSKVYFDPRYRPFGFEVVEDIGGGGVAELALLGVDEVGRVRAQMKDAATGQLAGFVYFDRNYVPSQAAGVDLDGDGQAEALAVVGEDAGGIVRAQVKEAASATRLSTVRFESGYEVEGLLAVPDVDGSGTPELAALQRQAGTGTVRVQVKDALTAGPVRAFVLAADGESWDAVVLEDVSGNGKAELAWLGEDAQGNRVLQVRDVATGALISHTSLP